MRTPLPRSLSEFARSHGPDPLEKCRRWHRYVDEVRATGVFDAMYRIELQGPLDHRILARDASTGETRELVASTRTVTLGCFCIRGFVPPRTARLTRPESGHRARRCSAAITAG